MKEFLVCLFFFLFVCLFVCLFFLDRYTATDAVYLFCTGVWIVYSGTLLFPRLMSYYTKSTHTVEKTGLISIWIFWLLLLPGLIAFFASGESTITDYTVMVSMAVSRIGLWSFDLAETQIMQKYIVEEERGLINATQTAMYQLFYCLMQVGGIVFPHPKDFYILVYFSMFVVFFACGLYSHWYKSKLD